MKIKCPLCPDEIHPYSENDLVDHIELHHYNRDSAKYIQNLLFKIHEKISYYQDIEKYGEFHGFEFAEELKSLLENDEK